MNKNSQYNHQAESEQCKPKKEEMYLQKLETHYLYPKILIVLSKEIMFESNQIRKLRQTIKPLN